MVSSRIKNVVATTPIAATFLATASVNAPSASASTYSECGPVSAYSPDDSGTITASGQNVWNVSGYFVAHPWWPFGTRVYSSSGMFLGTVQDRGPYSGGRILDLWFPSGAEAQDWGVKDMCITGEK